tara:strand:+ start:962 stop:1150 length:189 start_codon:yes stop_codon:yes gene_type:complete
MTKHLWEEEFERQYAELVKEYIEEGYDRVEAKIRAMKDTKESMQDQLDFVEELWDKTLDSLD